MITRDEAVASWVDAGYSLIPIRNDGTKRPIFEWKRFMSERMNTAQMCWYLDGNPGAGIGIVCGAVSGNLEMLELEGRAADAASLAKILAEVKKDPAAENAWNIVNLGLVVQSPSGGIHFFYRISDHEVPGNEKVARRLPTEAELAAKPKDKVKVLAETRGEGGFVVAAPTGGTVHPSGKSWDIVVGSPGDVPSLTWDERESLHAAIYDALDEMPETQYVPPTPSEQAQRRSEQAHGDRTRPGDDFNYRANWEDHDMLGGNGWTVSHVQNGTVYWVKPGANPRDGHHATTGHNGAQDRLYVFSTATEFPTEEPLSKFAVYTYLNHGGDFKAATKALAADGYGEPLDRPGPLNEFIPNVAPADSVRPEPEPVIERTAQPRYRQTSVGNAERMVAEYSPDFRFIPQNKEWMAWDGTKWGPDYGQAQVTAAVTAMTYKLVDEAESVLASSNPADKEDEKAQMGKAMLKWANSSQMDQGMKGTISQFSRRSEVVAVPTDFDTATGFINVPNGVLDVANRKLLPHDRSYMMTQMFGATYDPKATCPRFEQFMATVLPDEKMRKFVQRAVGYSLLGRPDQRAMFIVHGPARTGKSQFLNLMSALFGDYGDTAMAGSFHKVDKKGDAATPGLHALRNKRFVSTSEESEHAVLDTESLKRLTGNEAITTRALYQDGQRWKPQMVLWIATNPLPQLNSDDNAIWDRIKPVPFTTKFSARGGEDSIKETPGISESIFAEEASGILNWALDGVAEFLAIGGLDQPEQIDKGVADYRHETDPVSQFLAEMQELGQLEHNENDRAQAKTIYVAFTEWCRDSGTYPINARRFHRRVRTILNIEEYAQSNGQYFLDGWRWTLRHGVFGSMP